MEHLEGVTIINRRGGRKPPKARDVEPPVFPEDIEAIILRDIAERDRRKRYWNGEGEFEPVFISMADDPELVREFADDPDVLMYTGQRRDRKDPDSWEPFLDRAGNRLVKVIPVLKRDHSHYLYKQDRWGDKRLNLIEGEQAEIKRRSNGSRLKEEELAMDHRSPSRFGWEDLGFHTAPFDLPDFPENVQYWLDTIAWPKYNEISERLIGHLQTVVREHDILLSPPYVDVRIERRKEQEARLVALWDHFNSWWKEKVAHAKEMGRYAPLASKHVASIKMIFETFRLEMGFDTPVMHFWGNTQCTVCGVERKRCIPLDSKEMFCRTCGDVTVEVTEWDPHDILDPGPPQVDWWERAAKLQTKINELYAEAAELSEILPLERYLRYIEVEHIKFDDPSMIFYSAYPEVDDRFV